MASRNISRKSCVGFSPATIRNEMSDLEQLGYLAQPHTSAGRVPSYKAYRLYVDQLLNVSKLPPEEREKMNAYLSKKTDQVGTLIRSAAAVISDATRYTSVIVAPKLSTLRIRNLQMVPVSDTLALMVIVTNAGIVKDTVIRVPEGITPDMLYEISRMLTEQLADKPIEAVRQLFAELIRDMGEHRRLLAEAMQVIEEKMTHADESDVVIGGGANMLSYPEYQDAGKAQNFLSVLESRDKLQKALAGGSGMEVTIRIGPENGLPELSDCSVLTATYQAGDDSVGRLGIIGPTRMNYNRAISVLRYMGMALSELLSDRK